MAVVPICYKMYYKDQTYPDQNIISPNKRCFLCECIAKPDAPRCFSSTINVRQNRRIGYSPASVSTTRTRSRGWLYASQGGCKGNTNEEQLRSLESYFGRLQGNTNEHQSDSSMSKTQLIDTGQLKSKNGLDSLDAYFDKLNEDADYDKDLPPTFDEEATKGNLASTPLPTQISVQDDEKKLKTYVKLGSKFPESTPKTPQQQDDEASDLHLISILASINIAVFLFEIASPVRNYEMELFSVPSLYGAKINELIMVGEWWRLVTPMFLVQD